MEDQKVECEITGLHNLLYKAIDYSDLKAAQGVKPDQAESNPDRQTSESEAPSS